MFEHERMNKKINTNDSVIILEPEKMDTNDSVIFIKNCESKKAAIKNSINLIKQKGKIKTKKRIQKQKLCLNKNQISKSQLNKIVLKQYNEREKYASFISKLY